MCNEPGDKIHDWQRHGFNSVGIVVQINISDVLAVKGLDSGFSDGRAFEVSAQVADDGGWVI